MIILIGFLVIQYLVIFVQILVDKGRGKSFKGIKSKKQLYQFLIPFCWVYFVAIWLFKNLIESLKELENE